jgi:hypothetical protein
MKMKNEDIIRLTEIKQFLLDPPVSFKLYSSSLALLEEARDILQRYPVVPAPTLATLEQLMTGMPRDRAQLKPLLIESGKLLAGITNK